MTSVDWHKEIEDAKALLTGHFVLASKKHSANYLNKVALFLRPKRTHAMGMGMANDFLASGIQTVVAPELGAIPLGDHTAYWLDMLANQPVDSVIAEKKQDDRKDFVFSRGYDEFVRGRRVLIVEDVLTTGGSVRKVVDLVRATGGEVVGVAALCNRGGVTAETLGAPVLRQLITLTLDSWEEADCPLCREGVPINTNVGKGAEYLAKKQAG
ncbi:MAG: phosphoribosyltransferase family protein [Patescibacteria group bacterium]